MDKVEKPFRKNSIIEVEIRRKSSNDIEQYVVTSEPARIEVIRKGKKMCGWSFTYASADPSKTHWYGWGSGVFFDEPEPFGWVKVTVIGEKQQDKTDSKYQVKLHGNTAYDLIHDPSRRLY